MQNLSLRKKVLLLVVFGLSIFNLQAQTDTSYKNFLDSININDLFKFKEKESSFKVRTSYLSNYVYAGRKDSATIPYFTPSIEYNHASGLYAQASVSYLTNSNFKQDMWSIEAGFNSDTIGKFSGSIYFNKPFYNTGSGNVQSDINWLSGLMLTYDANFINISAASNLMFGTKTDFALTLFIDQTFYIGNSQTSSFALTPSLSTFFGSTGFYQSTKTRRRIGNLPAGSTIELRSPNKFQLLAYELSVPISFDKEKWGLFINPTYAIAVNPVVATYKVTGPFGGVFVPNASIVEKLSNSFFAEMGFYYKF